MAGAFAQPRGAVASSVTFAGRGGGALRAGRGGRGGAGRWLAVVVAARSVPNAVIVAAQRVGEALRDGGVLALLPQRHHDQLAVALRAADVDQRGAIEIADQNCSSFASADPAGGARTGYASRDLELWLQGSADALAEAVGGVIGDGDEHRFRS
jgi:hypothetical protein